MLGLSGGMLATPAAAALPACTISWDGGAGTSSWHAGGNWNKRGRVPGGADHVCIGKGVARVVFRTGTTEVQSLRSQSPLRVTGGSLSLPTDMEAVGGSFVEHLTLTGGDFRAARLRVRDRLVWTGGDLQAGSLWEHFVVGPRGATLTRDTVTISGNSLLHGAMGVNGAVNIAETANLGTYFTRLQATGPITIRGDVESTWAPFDPGFGPNVLIEGTGELLNIPVFGRLRNYGIFQGSFTGLGEVPAGAFAVENSGTATFTGGNTGHDGILNRRGALVRMYYLELDGVIDNRGLIRKMGNEVGRITSLAPIKAGRWILEENATLEIGTDGGPGVVFRDANMSGTGEVVVLDQSSVAGFMSLGISVVLTLDGVDAKLAAATIDGTGTVRFEQGTVAPGPVSRIGESILTQIPVAGAGTLDIPTGATLVHDGVMHPVDGAHITGAGTLRNVGTLEAGACCGYVPPSTVLSIEPSLTNNGVLHAIDGSIRVSNLTNNGRMDVGIRAALDVLGAFTQSANGVFAPVADGSTYNLGGNAETPVNGWAGFITAGSATLAGSLEPQSGFSCAARDLPVLTAGTVSGAFVFGDNSGCDYTMHTSATGVTLKPPPPA